MNNQCNFVNSCSLEQHKFFRRFATEYLVFLGNSNPTAKQITEMHHMLSHVWMRQAICFDPRLTEKEQQCLYLSAQGKTLKELAVFFNISKRRVEQYRQSIFQKLACHNMVEAVFIGIRYGKISPEPLCGLP